MPTEQNYTWHRIFQIALEHKRQLIFAHIIAIIATLLNVPIPLLMPILVDEVLLNQPSTLVNAVNFIFPNDWHSPTLTIIAIASFAMLLRLGSLIFNVWEVRQFTIISKEVVFRIRKNLVARLQRVSMAEYETLGTGKVISHLVTDLDTVDNFIGASVSRLLIAALTMIGIAIVLLWMHWQLALFILLLNPIVIYFTITLGRKVKHLKAEENNAYAVFQQTLTETLEAIQQVRAYNREKHYLDRVIESAHQIRDHAINFAWKTDAAGRLSFNVFLFGFELFRAISMFMVLYADLTIGQMFAVFGYLWFMMGPMQEILNIQYAYHGAKAGLQRVNNLFELAEEPHYPHQHNPFHTSSNISVRLENVCFSYNQQTPETPVLDNLSFKIEAGEKIAFVGASGGGKTTLVHVLLGLYQPSIGQIYFNDIPVTEIGMDVVRENVVTVLQHPALFNDTLRTNLTLGREFNDDELWQALEIAQLSETVNNLEQGLETILGRGGIRLSGGQRQRVACARMILSDPKVVILDEATSALDTNTEARLHIALNKFLQNRTTIIIAHRLSAVKQADKVFVLEQGQIIETGHHAHLIQQNGVYAKLYGESH